MYNFRINLIINYDEVLLEQSNPKIVNSFSILYGILYSALCPPQKVCKTI